MRAKQEPLANHRVGVLVSQLDGYPVTHRRQLGVILSGVPDPTAEHDFDLLDFVAGQKGTVVDGGLADQARGHPAPVSKGLKSRFKLRIPAKFLQGHAWLTLRKAGIDEQT